MAKELGIGCTRAAVKNDGRSLDVNGGTFIPAKFVEAKESVPPGYKGPVMTARDARKAIEEDTRATAEIGED